MNGVGSMTRELGCAREPVRQVSQAELMRNQCVTGEIVRIVPHWLWGEGLSNLKVRCSRTSQASFWGVVRISPS
jgi:hypothetical protein